PGRVVRLPLRRRRVRLAQARPRRLQEPPRPPRRSGAEWARLDGPGAVTLLPAGWSGRLGAGGRVRPVRALPGRAPLRVGGVDGGAVLLRGRADLLRRRAGRVPVGHSRPGPAAAPGRRAGEVELRRGQRFCCRGILFFRFFTIFSRRGRVIYPTTWVS